LFLNALEEWIELYGVIGRFLEAPMLRRVWQFLRDSIEAFIADDALSWGASIAFYMVTSIGPVLFIVVAIAGLAFGEDAARGAIASRFRDLMGWQSADLAQSVIQNAAGKSTGILASIAGAITLLITVSGVFGEMQSALNVIWKAPPVDITLSRLLRARAASLGLVAALGFLLLVSVVFNTILSGLGGYLDAMLPFGTWILRYSSFPLPLR
jgi:membrane protein